MSKLLTTLLSSHPVIICVDMNIQFSNGLLYIHWNKHLSSAFSSATIHRKTGPNMATTPSWWRTNTTGVRGRGFFLWIFWKCHSFVFITLLWEYMCISLVLVTLWLKIWDGNPQVEVQTTNWGVTWSINRPPTLSNLSIGNQRVSKFQ